MDDYLKSSLVIKSATIIARKDGIPIYINRKGDPDSGIIFVKIDTLNGYSILLRRNLNSVIEMKVKGASFTKHGKISG